MFEALTYVIAAWLAWEIITGIPGMVEIYRKTNPNSRKFGKREIRRRAREAE